MAMGEAAMTKMEEANGGDLAARIERMEAIKKFVSIYAGLAITFRVLDFSSDEHQMWCDQVLDLDGSYVVHRVRRMNLLGIDDKIVAAPGTTRPKVVT